MIRGGRVTLFVADVATSVRFYIETLGMKLVEEREGLAIIDAGEGLRIGLERRVGTSDVSPVLVLEPKVPIAEAIAIFENRGVVFDGPLRESGGESVVRFRDADGNVLVLAQRLS